MNAETSTIYELDAGNRICLIEGNWDEFVRKNISGDQSSERLIKENVLGNRLENYIHDDATRMLLYTLIDGVRRTKQVKTIRYRCDSPNMKRFMRMVIEPQKHEGVRLIHSFLRSENLDPPVEIEPVTADTAKHNVRCSICNRIELNRCWLEPDEAAMKSGKKRFHVSYTVCPICMNTA
ncbi:MAG: hypothetical protein ABW098_09490 [Candidatus Thiodiazotropha sp.]